MKKFFFSVAALAAALSFTACSDENFVGGVDNSGAEWDENGNGYVTVSINLPVDQRTSNRANDKYMDGTVEEYTVKNATLLVFGNNTEDEQSAVFAGAYPLNLKATTDGGDMVSGSWDPSKDGQTGNGNENITVHDQAVAKISRMGGQYAYILAIINSGNKVTTSGNELLIEGQKFEGTFADFCKLNNKSLDLEATDFHQDANGFLMLNAPMADIQGGDNDPSDAKIHVLAHVDRTQIKASQADAVTAAKDGKVAARVYVERAVAKVTLGAPTGQKVEGTNIDWSLTEWSLDNTNKSSYVIRNIEGMEDWLGYYSKSAGLPAKLPEFKGLVDKYRFVGSKKAETYVFPGTTKNLWRTYFTKDMNYDAYDNESFNYVGDAHQHENKLVWHNSTKPGYCAENTFNVRNQIWGATTRAIVKTTLNGGNDFYAIEGANVIYTPTEALNTAKSAYVTSVNEWIESDGKYYLTSYDTSKLTFDQASDGKDNSDKKPTYTATWQEGAFVFADAQTVADKLNERDFGNKDYTQVDNPATGTKYDFEPAGWHKVDNVSVKTLVDVPAYDNNIVNLCIYEKGVTYYETRIQHFGDDGCPWNNWETTNKPSVAEGAYPGNQDEAEANYLGRWGVLRNNWYDLTVTKISKIGSATVPTLKGNERNTDDELDQYIAVDVNILSWAYRGQEVKF